MKCQLLGFCAVLVVLLVFSVDGIEGQLGDPSLRCPRCPVACPSPQGYPLSCRNACKSYSTRFTEVHCSSGRCNCKDPNSRSSTLPSTATNAIRPSSG